MSSPKRLTIILFFLILILARPAGPSGQAAPAALTTPNEFLCTGLEADAVTISWKDAGTDETHFKVFRSVGNLTDWVEIAQIATMTEDYSWYKYVDDTVDTSSADNYYYVTAYDSHTISQSAPTAICTNPRMYEHDIFRIFYNIEGLDECWLMNGKRVCLQDDSTHGLNDYVSQLGEVLEGVRATFLRHGFDATKMDGLGGYDLLPIRVFPCDGGGCAGTDSIGLAATVLEEDFDHVNRTGDPKAWVVPLHEYFHVMQFGYWGLDDPNPLWVLEGQARMSQDRMCIGGNSSTGYCFDDQATGLANYLGQVNAYLNSTTTSLLDFTYSTALFWSYLMEHYGASLSGDAVEAGWDIVRRFWEDSNASPGRDGVTILNSVLADMGYTERFRDIWKDFAIANYAKDLSGPNVPAKYLYEDDDPDQGLAYNSVNATTRTLEPFGAGSEFSFSAQLPPWASKYYKIIPDPDLLGMFIYAEELNSAPVSFAVLGIKDGDLVFSHTYEGDELSFFVPGPVNELDEVAIVVASLENAADYELLVNSGEITFELKQPTTTNFAEVGPPDDPGKFLVIVEMIGPDHKPVVGADLSAFTFHFGAYNFPEELVLSRAYVNGQYWFILQAPEQNWGETHVPLAVKYGELSDWYDFAVIYREPLGRDNVLVIDRSGSMASDEKLVAAQAAAHLFVDSLITGDKIGILSFAYDQTVDMSLADFTTEPNGGSRQDAFDAIEALVAGGGTKIGDALRMGWNELIANGDSEHKWYLVLLSDGREEYEFDPPNETFEELIDAIETAQESGQKTPVVHAIALGADADHQGMQSAAERTQGTYHFQPDTSSSSDLLTSPAFADPQMQLNLASFYRNIAAEIAQTEPFFTFRGPIVGDGDEFSDTVEIPVEAGASHLTLTMNWAAEYNYISSVVLWNPNLVLTLPTHSDTRHRVWQIANPTPGTWSLYIHTDGPNDLPPGAESPAVPTDFLPKYLVKADVRSDISLEAYLTPSSDTLTPGVEIPIIATLTDTGPITGATVVAMIAKPQGSAGGYLYDDGLHNDGAADDGIYGTTFYATSAPGNYSVAVLAAGYTALSGDFQRQKQLSFYIHSAGDSDGDGMPDEYEERFGLNPDVDDSGLDPDDDGLTNDQERVKGTDPTDPDSDDGGEVDGTDANPFDPADDAVRPPRIVAYPGDGEVLLRYTVDPNYSQLTVKRGDNPGGPFSLHTLIVGLNGVYIDNTVTNGNTYCYQVFALSPGHRSVNAPVTCATPQGDHYPPYGTLKINRGAASTLSPQVILDIWAKDGYDNALQVPGDAYELLGPGVDSGIAGMMISNNPGFKSAVWLRYATVKDWILAGDRGLNYVYIKFRDDFGNISDTFSAAIYLNTGPGVEEIFLPIVIRP